MRNRWTREDEKILRENYSRIPTVKLAKDLGRTTQSVYNKAQAMGLVIPLGEAPPPKAKPVLETPIPSPNRPVGDIIRDQAARFAEKKARWGIKHEGIRIRLPYDGPYGIVLMGDPHADDDGCDLEHMAYDLALIEETPHVYGALMGDLTNNWVGKLRGLFAHQHTTDDEAVALMGHLLDRLGDAWLFVILGNHDKWGPVAGLLCSQRGITCVSHGAMFKVLAGDHELLIDARHTHPGNSMYNPSHGPLKKNHRGSPADIIASAHTHTSAYTLLRNGITGKVGHALRIGAYKRFDEYADTNGFEDGQISPSVMCVIDPEAGPEGAIVVFHDLESGRLYLQALRDRFEANNAA